MAHPTYPLLALWLVIMSVCSAQSTYYVTPTPDTVCPGSPCLTISQCVEWANDHLFPSNTTWVFLPGDHSLESNLAIANASRFVMIAGNSTFLPKTTIVCNGLAAFVFKNVSDLQIYGLEFKHCGSDTLSTIEVSSVLQSEITNCTIRGSVNSSISAADSDLIIWESRLNYNNGLGLKLLRSTAKLFGNAFTSNGGGGIASINSTVALITSNSFVNNSADTRCGGISASGSIIYLNGSTTFIGNRAEEGGGIYLEDTTLACEGAISFLYNSAYNGGGMVTLRSNVNLSGQNTFMGNSATDCISENMCSFGYHFGGGALFWRSNVHLKGNTTFEGNSATHGGGGIELEDSKLLIEGETKFTSNSAEFGGGMDAQNGYVSLTGNTTVTSNLARVGGGIYLESISPKSNGMFLEDTTGEGPISFLYNSAYDGGGMAATQSNMNQLDISDGGLQTLSSAVILFGSIQFVDNFAERYGGGIVTVNSIVTLSGTTSFTQNSAVSDGGGIFTSKSTMKLSGNNYIANNYAKVNGGGIRMLESNMTLYGSTTQLNNTAKYGGAVCTTAGSYLILSGIATFTNNSAIQGGGICVEDSKASCVGNTSFVSNLAEHGGGGLLALTDSIVELEGSNIFMHNSAEFGGGIASVNGSSLIFRGNTTYTANQATRGGGLDSQYSTIASEGYISFANNVANLDGGGFMMLNSRIKLEGSCNFLNNSAHGGGGGGVFAGYGSDLTLKGNASFVNNSALQGGGINLQDSILNFKSHIHFESNLADQFGGGLATLNGTVNFDGRNSFVNNSVHYSGGGVAMNGSNFHWRGNNLFTNNSAILGFGGGIVIQESNMSIEGYMIFTNNFAQYGGGLAIGSPNFMNSGAVSVASTVTFDARSSFVQNSAIRGGGVYSVDRSDLTLKGDASFVNNSAVEGAGIYSQHSVLNCKSHIHFENNLAAQYGGGLVSVNGTINFHGSSNIVNNSAVEGAGIYLQQSVLNCKSHMHFENNLAVKYGGGLESVNGSVNFHGSSNFVNNSALLVGGGVAAGNGSILSWSGNQSFTSNSALLAGGGVAVLNGSVLCWSGNQSFTNNSATTLGFGGGIYIEDSTMTSEGCMTFTNNFARSGGGFQSANGTVIFDGSSSFVSNSAGDAGGGVAATNGSNISWRGNNSFTNNSATTLGFGGGINSLDSNMSIEGYMTFTNNFAGVGGGLDVRILSHLSSTATVSFVNNSAQLGGATFCYKSHLEFRGANTFVRNTAIFGGGAMATISGCTVSFSGNNTFIRNSADYGGAAHLINTTITFTGRSLFLNNTAGHGGGIHSRIVTLRISDVVSFTGNSATTNGGGLTLTGSSQCILSPDTTVYFSDNHAAQYGGAIYIADDPFLYCSYELTNLGSDSFQERCFFQPPKLLDENSGVTVHFILQNNFAEEAGSAVYGGMLDRCFLTSFYNVSSGARFDNVFTIIEHETENATTAVSAISSDPIQVCPCYNDYINCTKSQKNVTVFPGEIFAVHVVAVGQRNGIVPSFIKSNLNRSIATLDDLQDAQSAGTKCTPLQYRVFSQNRAVMLQLYADGVCLEQGRPLSVNVTILPCPIAFELSDTTKGCVCEERLRRYTDKCNITTRMIEHTGEIWVGKNDYGTILHRHCPFDYCKAHTVIFAMNETDLQCNYDRRGVLCGDCQPGLSLALGTSRCLHCGNVYLLLLIGFAIAGITLVILILACKLTVAVGTINGLIFYANIVSVNKSVFLDSSERALSVFIAWVNLDLGIETCFYDGMDVYERTWLQFIFPAYIWVLVGIIIILGNRYPWAARLFGKNPVAVLATLFLLSYAKLLNTLIAALSFTFLNYPDGSEVAVWLYNGNIGYLRGKHIPLFIAALLVLILLFLPYTLFLLLGQWIQARSEMRIFSWINDYRVKSFIDAYHGPFRDEHRYWNGLLLVVRCCLFLVFAFNALGNPNVNLLTIVTSTIMLLVLLLFAGGRIYKNWYLQALDVSYIVNIGILAAATYYVRCAGGNQTALAYTSVGIALLTFIGIMFYHAITQIKGSHVWREIIAPKLRRRQRQWVAVPTEPPPLPPTVPQLPTRSIVDLSALIREDESNL